LPIAGVEFIWSQQGLTRRDDVPSVTVELERTTRLRIGELVGGHCVTRFPASGAAFATISIWNIVANLA
jgi:hypothetical protein